jgi:hypothetical protein
MVKTLPPDILDFKQLSERYRAIKAEKRDSGRKSDALSLASEMDKKLYESIETVEKK